MSEDNWTILTFETNKGEKVIDEFMLKQQAQTKAKIVHTVRLLKQYGNELGIPTRRCLVRDYMN